MKTYKYNINGNDYEVAVEGIENYVATVVVLIAVSIRQRRESQPPASLGNAYFREDR